MPIIDPQELPSKGTRVNERPVSVTNPVGFTDALSSAFSIANSLTAVGEAAGEEFEDAQAARDDRPAAADWDVFDDIAGYEEFADKFIDVTSPDHAQRIKRRIDEERKMRSLVDEAGAEGVGALLLAAAADPVNLIPVGGSVLKSVTTGGRVLETARVGAKAGFVSGTAAEGLLYASKDTATPEEAAIGIAFDTLFGGVLGGATRLAQEGWRSLSGKDLSRILDDAREQFSIPDDPSDDPLTPGFAGANNLSAAFADDATIDGNTLKSAFGVEKFLADDNIMSRVAQDPGLRLAFSPSLKARRIGEQMVEGPWRLQKNTEGIASSLATETRIKGWDYRLFSGLRDLDTAFLKYRGVEKIGGAYRTRAQMAKVKLTDTAGRSRGKLSWDDFKREVAKATRRDDKHEIPEVAEAARAIRERVLEPGKQDAIKARLFDEDVQVTTADSYLHRVYNTQKIKAERPVFRQRLVDWLNDRRVTDEELADLSDAEIDDIAEQIIDKILGHAVTRVPYQLSPLERGPLKDRTLDISDFEIEDFLENDIERVLHMYTRTMAPDVELTRSFGRADLDDQINQVRDDYKRLFDKAKTEKERQKLSDKMDKDISDIRGLRDRLRNVYALPDDPLAFLPRAARMVKSQNYLSKLGGMTLTAIPDMGHMIMAHGFGRVFGDGLKNLVADTKAFNVLAEEVKLAGTALDVVLDTRAMSLADIELQYPASTRFERGMDAMTDNFGLASLQGPWNAGLKQLSGIVTYQRMYEAVMSSARGTVRKGELEKLAQQGIDQRHIGRLKKMFDAHGETGEKGLFLPNTERWEDAEIRDLWRGALAKEVDRIIVTPGQIKPLWMSTQLGGVIGQFKSFVIAAAQKVMIAGLQQRDANFYMGLTSMVALGMMSYYLKAKISGYEVSDEPAVWVNEGIDRSGFTGWFFEANNMLEKMTRGNVGLSYFTEQQMSRYASRNAVGAFLGPSFGMAEDVRQVLGSAFADDWRESDSRALRRMIPYQNLFYLRWLFDSVEEGVNRELGVPRQ